MAFEGPLFIVGLSRSGTTLLRNLLNRNSRISMTPVESHFIPFLIRKYGKNPDFSSPKEKEGLRHDLEKTLFFRKMMANHRLMDWPALDDIMETGKWDRIIPYIFQSFAEKTYESGMIWGDTSHMSWKSKKFYRNPDLSTSCGIQETEQCL